jgi:hypothetical protein
MALELNGTTGVQGNSGAFVAGTAVATTSGTSVTFSSIPSWVKRITVMFNGVNLASSQVLVQIGSGSTTSSGYASSALVGNTGGTGNITSSAGFIYSLGGGSGHYVLTLVSSNTWAGSGIIGSGGTVSWGSGISPALGGALDRVIITSASGSAAFNAGSVNILYE